MSRPTKEKVKAVMEQVDAEDYSDAKHWQEVHRRLRLPYGDVFDYIAEDPAFFGAKKL